VCAVCVVWCDHAAAWERAIARWGVEGDHPLSFQNGFSHSADC